MTLNASAARIIELCTESFLTSSGDCNKFVKSVANQLFQPEPFASTADADHIVGTLRNSAQWTKLGTSHVDAIGDAKSGLFVVAGMTSTELSSDHGHLAVVIGTDGQLSGNVRVPLCYAGSLKPKARVEHKRVSETFGATEARECRISYFSRRPNR